MDQAKIGRFIAALRKEHNLTQEALGEKLGVTNKTISRWENGNYMPDVEMLLKLSKEFDISINELLTGERLTSEEFKKAADENLATTLNNSLFTLKGKILYYKKQWRKEHRLLIIFSILIWVALILIVKQLNPVFMGAVGGFCGFLIYLVLYNRMMIFVEKNAYDPVIKEDANVEGK